MNYFSQAFNPVSLDHAKDIALTPDSSFPDKFDLSTKSFVDVLEGESIINQDSVVVDFGVGMGRISKELIDRFNCRVIGTDISLGMLILATQYVNQPFNFVTCNRINIGECADVLVASLVLQHVEDPAKEIDYIFEVLKSKGIFVLLNEPSGRYVPVGLDSNNYVIWQDDKFNINDYIESKFVKIKEIPYQELPGTAVNKQIVFYQKS